MEKADRRTAVSDAPKKVAEEDRTCLRDAQTGQWLAFSQPYKVIGTCRTDEVPDCLREVESLVSSQGWAAAGFLSYEAAPAFDDAFRVRADHRFPLLRFGLFPPPCPVDIPESLAAPPELSWTATVSQTAYKDAFARIQRYIAAGDTYQVNYTHRLRAPFTGDAWPLFASLAAAHDPRYGGFLQTPDWTILSLSPELFFQRQGETVVSIPMKGTLGRALTADDDRWQGERLQRSGKDRAENVMIVDMVRNDLARIARPGSVRVADLFAVERYPTLWQMISSVAAESGASLCDIFTALFPAASITGAPKARTMALIRELETEPRRIYTGTIGFLLPDGRAQFNVAIRTLLLDRRRGQMEYGVGGGITADSTASGEYEETRLKSLICRKRRPDFSLLETLLWTPEQGYLFLAEHMDRLCASAGYFAYPCRAEAVRECLSAATAGYGGIRQRVRLLLDRHGKLHLEAVPFAPADTGQPARIMLAPHPIDNTDVFFYHKTTRRELYDRMRAALPPGLDDVLFYNGRGEITETTIANIAVTIEGRRCTPPIRCGLLAGTCRQHLLRTGQLEERVLTLDDLSTPGAFTLINSVRGRYPAILAASG